MVDDGSTLPDLASVATPALLVERGQLVANIERMAARAASAGVALRPHAKTHKSLEIAALQRARGAVGLTVATLREAEVFAAAGFDDLLVSCPPAGEFRLDGLVRLAKEVRVQVVVDDARAVELLDGACRRAGIEIGYLWEIDCGVGRFGTSPGEVTAEAIAAVVASTECCVFDGLMAFGGHVYQASGLDEIGRVAADERRAVTETAAALEARGIEARVRSIGTTPTTHEIEDGGSITEIRPGNYVFYDATQVALELVDLEQCALAVLATVMSRPSSDRLILDAGSKALAAERPSARAVGFGLVRGYPTLRVERLYEEQAIVAVDGPCDLKAGDRVEVVPNHACAAVNLHERILVVDRGVVVEVWPVAVRGWDPYVGGGLPVMDARAAARHAERAL